MESIRQTRDQADFYCKVPGYEMEVREKVKKAGGIWRPRQKLWELSYAKIVALGLENRIITDQRG